MIPGTFRDMKYWLCSKTAYHGNVFGKSASRYEDRDGKADLKNGKPTKGTDERPDPNDVVWPFRRWTSAVAQPVREPVGQTGETVCAHGGMSSRCGSSTLPPRWPLYGNLLLVRGLESKYTTKSDADWLFVIYRFPRSVEDADFHGCQRFRLIAFIISVSRGRLTRGGRAR